MVERDIRRIRHDLWYLWISGDWEASFVSHRHRGLGKSRLDFRWLGIIRHLSPSMERWNDFSFRARMHYLCQIVMHTSWNADSILPPLTRMISISLLQSCWDLRGTDRHSLTANWGSEVSFRARMHYLCQIVMHTSWNADSIIPPLKRMTSINLLQSYWDLRGTDRHSLTAN
jgi:hypothetical protein